MKPQIEKQYYQDPHRVLISLKTPSRTQKLIVLTMQCEVQEFEFKLRCHLGGITQDHKLHEAASEFADSWKAEDLENL